MKTKRTSTAVQRWGKCALTLLLACALLAGLAITASARGTDWQGEVVDPAIPKPTVTIQGNLVVDKPGGKPTGFYELALCVRSGRTIYGPDPDAGYAAGTEKELTEAEYAKVLSDIEKNLVPMGITQDSYTLTYYPFRTATAAVNVNTDVLTAVNWAIQNVTYQSYDPATGYAKDAADPGAYPRGIDTDVAVQGYDALGLTTAEAFPDITTPDLLVQPSVAIDVEGDSRMFAATGQVDYYDATANAALLTLSASAPSNKSIILTEDTPLVVARFSYDLKRFTDVEVNTTDWQADVQNSATGKFDEEGLWLGWDKSDIDPANLSGLKLKTPLTWLGESVDNSTATPAGYARDFADMDRMIARTRMNQSVWVHMETNSEDLTQRDTYFYYYLGAEEDQRTAGQTKRVNTASGIQEIKNIDVPVTEGATVLTQGNDLNTATAPDTPADYTYFKNLLRLKDRTLVVKLVNDVTFKKPSGGFGGNTILFYDWDDKLIGNLIVENGDVREAVNNYVEQNLVHPDLRASTVLTGTELGGKLPDFTTAPAAGSDAEQYEKLITSLDREYTYRGEQDSVYGGGTGSVSYPEKGQTGYDETKAGSSYPLTNKLDYAFYKRLNTVTAVDTEDTTTGKSWTERYFKVDDLTADPDAALYPWIYGWAIVADPDNHTLSTKSGWPIMVDSDKLESTWTTFGTGELADQAPGDGNVLTGFATPMAPTPPATNPTVAYPGGLSVDWSTDPLYQTPTQYAYQTSSADANGYLRFADFSDINAMFLPGQNVLVVKAVYEPGTSLDPLGNYTVVENSLDMRRYSTTASTENGVYSFAFQYQRGWDTSGLTPYRGVRRVRDPAVKTGFVYDAKSVDETIDLSQRGMFYMQNLANGGDILDVDLTSGGDLWDMAYTLVERYGTNFANGANRSGTSDWGALIKKNFLYDPDDPKYDERQGTDGFVTQLTLITLLEEASKAARGEDNILATHCTVATLQDLNFKAAAGDPPVEYDFFTAGNVEGYIRDLVKRLYDDGVSIDPLTGNVTLTWHQVQRHILMCEAAGGTAVPGIYSGGVLMTDAQCAGFAWCRIDDCAGDVKMEINSVNDVLEAIYLIQTKPGTTDAKKAQEALYGDGTAGSTGITAATLEGYGFRTRAEGVPYPPATDPGMKDAVLNDLKAVVTALTPTLGTTPDWSTVTWEQIQTEIIKHNMGASTPATLNFWWQVTKEYPNGNPPAIQTWSDLLTYSYHAWVGVDFEGDGTPDAKVPDAFKNFTSEKVSKATLDDMIKEHVHGNATGEYANMGWLRKGVDVNGEAIEFANADEFRAAWMDALDDLSKPISQGGGGYDTIDELKAAPWEEIQYAVLTGKYKSYADIMAEVTAGTLDLMYWNDGGQPTLTFDKLLDAVNEYYFSGGSTSTKLDKLLSKGIDPVNNQVYLRKDDAGGSFADVAEFKSAVYNAIRALQFSTFNGSSFIDTSSGTNKVVVDEYELQYMLIHYAEFGTSILNMPTSAQIQADHAADETVNNYWWFGGGAPSGAMPIRNIKELFTAYFWYKGTSMGVAGQNPDALNRLDAAVMKTVGLRQDTMGIPYSSITTAQVVAALDKLPYSAATLGTASDADLMKELQYALLEGGYAPAGSITDEYWWQSASGAYPAPTDQESLLKAAWAAYIGDGAGNVVDEAMTALDGVDPAWVSARQGGLALRRDADGKEFPDLDRFKGMLEPAVRMLADPGQGNKDYGHLGSADVTQRQLQYFLLDPSAYLTDAAVQAITIDTSTDPATDAYWWFTSDKKPGTGPVITEKPIDPSAWQSFVNAANDYVMQGVTMDDLTLDLVQNTLHLRSNAEGTLETDLSAFYDGSGGDLLTNAIFAVYTAHAEYWDENDGVTLLTYPTWYEFQYALLHADDIMNDGSMPDATDLADAGQTDFPWRFETTGPVNPPTEPEEKPIDPAAWQSFVNAANDYVMQGVTMGDLTLDLIQNTLHLRSNTAGTLETDLSAFYDGSGGDLLTNAIFAVYTAHAEYWDENDGVTLLTYPTWYEFQYALLHADDIMNDGSMPDATDLEDAGQTDFPWRFTGLEEGASLDALDMGAAELEQTDPKLSEEEINALRETAETIRLSLPTLEKLDPSLAAVQRTVLERIERQLAEQDVARGAEETEAQEPPAGTLISQPSADSFPLPGGSQEDPEPEEEPSAPVKPEPSPEPEPEPDPVEPEHEEREEEPEGEEARSASVGTVVSTGNLGEILQARVKEMLDGNQASARENVTDVEPNHPFDGLGLFLAGVGVGAIAWGGTAPVGLQVVGLPEQKERKRKSWREWLKEQEPLFVMLGSIATIATLVFTVKMALGI